MTTEAVGAKKAAMATPPGGSMEAFVTGNGGPIGGVNKTKGVWDRVKDSLFKFTSRFEKTGDRDKVLKGIGIYSEVVRYFSYDATVRSFCEKFNHAIQDGRGIFALLHAPKGLADMMDSISKLADFMVRWFKGETLVVVGDDKKTSLVGIDATDTVTRVEGKFGEIDSYPGLGGKIVGAVTEFMQICKHAAYVITFALFSPLRMAYKWGSGAFDPMIKEMGDYFPISWWAYHTFSFCVNLGEFIRLQMVTIGVGLKKVAGEIKGIGQLWAEAVTDLTRKLIIGMCDIFNDVNKVFSLAMPEELILSTKVLGITLDLWGLFTKVV